MIEILESLQARIAEIKEFSYVGEDWGQLNYEEIPYPLSWPCALISIKEATFEDNGKSKSMTSHHKQQGFITLDITVATLKFSSQNSNSEDVQANAWEGWNYLKKIHEKLHEWRPKSFCGTLKRSSWKSVLREDGIQELHVFYTMNISNC